MFDEHIILRAGIFLLPRARMQEIIPQGEAWKRPFNQRHSISVSDLAFVQNIRVHNEL